MTPVARKRLAFSMSKIIPRVRPGGKSIRKGGQTAAGSGCLDRKPSILSSHTSTAGASGCWSGYGIFSVSPSLYDKTFNYIQNQKNHHKKASFKEELLLFLKQYNIDYDERYLWTD